MKKMCEIILVDKSSCPGNFDEIKMKTSYFHD